MSKAITDYIFSKAYVAVHWNSKSIGFSGTVVAYVKVRNEKYLRKAVADKLVSMGYSEKAALRILNKCSFYKAEEVALEYPK